MLDCSHVASLPRVPGWHLEERWILGAYGADEWSAFQLVCWHSAEWESEQRAALGWSPGLVSAVLGGTATLTKSTGGTVVLRGANDLSGLMVVNAGSLVIANAGSVDTRSIDGGWDWGGAGSWRYGAERVCVPTERGHSAEWESDGE
jgi:autotransporter-associated beta strand protein